MTTNPTPPTLTDALARLITRIRASTPTRTPVDTTAIESMTPPAFRALVAERLRTLERDVAEIRTRVNGLLFVTAGAVLSQLVLRLFA